MSDQQETDDTPLSKRDRIMEAVDEAIRIQSEHISIARGLINRWLPVVRNKDSKPDELEQATAMLDKATKMETRARAEVIKLTKERPN